MSDFSEHDLATVNAELNLAHGKIAALRRPGLQSDTNDALLHLLTAVEAIRDVIAK